VTRRFPCIGAFALLGLVGVLGVVSGSSASPRPVAVWENAIEVPGIASLNRGGDAQVVSVSCATAGDCAAGGSYKRSGNSQAFVVSEANGSWGNAIEVPGAATLNSGGDARVNSVSCATAGNCAAGGYYTEHSDPAQAFVVRETNGRWGRAIEVPGTSTLNSGGNARVNSVSCATAGNCAAVGSYLDGSGNPQAFVASETNGSWGSAIEVPGTATLNTGGDARVNSVSCTTAGNCTAGGSYADGVEVARHYQAFVVSETDGIWGSAIEVPGTATLNSDGYASVLSVSCAKPGNCTAGGSYLDGSDHYQAFVASETNGIWGNAIEVPGSATLNSGGLAGVNSVACATAGNCAAVGLYTDGSGNGQAFVVSETNGVWGSAIEVPGTATLNRGGFAEANSVSCATAGNCAAGGLYRDRSTRWQGFVVSETNGSWGGAIERPGTATLNRGGDASVNSVSCTTAGNCTAGGSYVNPSDRREGFVVSSSSSTSPCIVPKLIGETLGEAKKMLTAAGCTLGRRTTVYASAKKGRVVAQHPKHGTHLQPGGKVALTLSKGPK